MRTAIALDGSGNLYSAKPSGDNSVYTQNPYTGDSVKIATFNDYVEELAFDSNGNLHALEGVDGEGDPSTIIMLIPPHVTIDGCDTGIIEWPLLDGSTITEKIQGCADTTENHEEFVRCVFLLTCQLKEDRIINRRERAAILICAAQADLP